MEHRVRIYTKTGIVEKSASDGTILLDFLRENSIDVDSPCGGKGICGKCRIRVNGLEGKISAKERSLLGNKALTNGYRLACYNRIESDMEIYSDDTVHEAKIATEGKKRSIRIDPIIKKKFVSIDTPDIQDQRSDTDRLMPLSGKMEFSNSIELMRTLPHTLREDNYRATMVHAGDELIAVEPGDTTGKIFGMAVDIGTTTIAAYLYDLTTGKRVDVHSLLNPQKVFGADVISRIEYTMSSRESLDEMNGLIVDCINQIVKHFTAHNEINSADIYAAVFVGNTTMMHFLMKLPAGNIAVSPFIPVTTGLFRFNARLMGIDINPFGKAIVFPAVSAYIGADTVAAVLSSGLYTSSRISLLIDIGTNGEIVLGNRKWIYSCSAAAGPAFEGANIRNGIGGVKGAIDRVKFGPELSYTTIGGESAIGICGSGIVDAVAGMLSTGIIDETGRIVDTDEAEELNPDIIRDRLQKIDKMNSFLLVKSEECAAGMDIAITQKDVRELQNAKAAIAAGIRILVKQAGINTADIDRVYLAGGFGSYMDMESALKIGLIPSELKGRIESIGNAAGSGAIEGLLSEAVLGRTLKIRKEIRYIELSACPDFMDEYVECMMFEG